MKSGFRKLLVTLCTLALLLTSFTAVFADGDIPKEQPEEQAELLTLETQQGEFTTEEEPEVKEEPQAEADPGQKEESEPAEESKQMAEPEDEGNETPVVPEEMDKPEVKEDSGIEEDSGAEEEPKATEEELEPTEAEENQLPDSDLPSDSEKEHVKPENEGNGFASESVQIENELKSEEEQPKESQPEATREEIPEETRKDNTEEEQLLAESTAEPEEPETTDQTAEAKEPEEQAEQDITEEQGKTEEPETPVESDQPEELISDLNKLYLGKKGIEGTLKAGEEYVITYTSKYNYNLIFTLILKQQHIGDAPLPVSKDGKETGLKIFVADRQKELTWVENEDPESTDVIYTFTAYTEKNQDYDIRITSCFDADLTIIAVQLIKEETPKQDEKKEIEETEQSVGTEDNKAEIGKEETEAPAEESVEEESTEVYETPGEISEKGPADIEQAADPENGQTEEALTEEEPAIEVSEEKPANEEPSEEFLAEEKKDISADNTAQVETADGTEPEKKTKAEDSLKEEKQTVIEKSETDNEAVTDYKTKQEEKEKPVEIPDDQTMLTMGYYKVQVLRENGTSLITTIETYEETEHLPFGTELWVKPTEEKEYAEAYSFTNETNQYVKWNDLLIVLQKEKEQAESADENEDSDTDEEQKDAYEKNINSNDKALNEQAEEKSAEEIADEETEEPLARSLRISSTLTSMGGFIDFGTPITITVEIVDFKEDDEYTCKWQYSIDGVDFIDIENADGLTYTYPLSKENFSYTWKFIISLSDSE